VVVLVCAWAAATPGFAQDKPASDKPAGVEGEVRNALDGGPVERVHVSLRATDNGGAGPYGASTGVGGKFTIFNISPGNYIIAMDRTGFLDMNGPAESLLALKAGEKKDALQLKLTPAGSITGRVLDADGKAVESVTVMAESGTRRDRGGVTDDRGMYRIGGLRPGKYRVRAAPEEPVTAPEIRTDNSVEVHYSATYHPNVLDAKSAARVPVGAGTEVPGIDIHLVRTPILHIGGKVAGLPTGAQTARAWLRPVGAPSAGNNGVAVRPNGSFEFWGPIPGKYTIQATYYSSDVQLSSAPMEMVIGNEDAENIVLQLMPPEDIQGRLDFLDEVGNRDAARLRISLRDTAGSQTAEDADVGEDGAFTLRQVAPAKYRLLINERRVYVQRMQLGPSAMDGNLLDVRNGSGGATLRVSVAAATAMVQGTVRDEKGPVAGARVILSEDAADGANRFSARTKVDGAYAFIGVAPGRYRVGVVDDAEAGADFEDIGESVEVGERQTVNHDLKRKGS
jgi:hypothetical protein